MGSWYPATLVALRQETWTARTLRFDVPGWPGHLPGQHVDVRLTAEDGYVARRSYSLSAPADGETISMTVQLVEDGEVSPYLVEEMELGDQLEVLGPVGGWFVWPPGPAASPDRPGPVLLIGGGWSHAVRGARDADVGGGRSRPGERAGRAFRSNRRMTVDDNTYLDGNALAGPLGAVFAADLTAATGVCAGCGHEEVLAAAPVYGAPMGLVARCNGCDMVLLRYADLPTGQTLEMSGIAALHLPSRA
ncbi:DUF6510 family protein [Nocardioides nematodiphilus]|uniref:DUF6510 family protein n=1 Tax=Nocardioides nematodiphilus TaxID=2849669 RepID=UPI001CD965A6|nr:DUF6510 family protein [Nocardioides nematodiphilus]MCA1984745.1 DUF6510 family protein [Nocardioides nematodiphilus]